MILSFSPAAIAACDTIDLPCGKCIGCENDRRNRWISRMELESYLHDGVGTFITLTYAKAPPTLRKKDVQDFLKRFRQLRRRFANMPDFKYFFCGEYGSKKKRPHYHGLLFGLDLFDLFQDDYIATVKDNFPVYSSPTLEKCWSFGFVTIDRITPANIRYVSKYITKQSRLSDEFTLKSIGLGSDFFFRFGDTRRDVDCGQYFAEYEKGIIHLPSRRGKLHNVPIPIKSFDRYLEIVDPLLLAELKERRRHFALLQKSPSALADRAKWLQIMSVNEPERILHNEC